jgi:serine/threonine protein kinase/EAL domain-containing protein (putative c-di-GMP-specific phosphodiesterase class I)/DNA-binding NarL/FixJ family response regulator
MRCPECNHGNPLGVYYCERCGMGLPDPAADFTGYRDFRLPPGTVLKGTYQLVRLLGDGGAGVVYKARHTSLGHALAVKILNPALALSDEMRRRFLAEARIQANFQHPHSVMVLDSIDEDGTCGIVMEFIDGETLYDFLVYQRDGLPVATVMDIALRILDALAAAHARGIVHRDVKPANILLKEVAGGVVPKLCDFGLAKVVAGASPTRPGTRMGTEAYMAPEQMTDAAQVDGRADIFAIGRTIYEMLTGVGETSPQMRRDAGPLALAHTLRGDVPEHVSAALRRAMAEDRDARFATADAFAEALVGDGEVGAPLLEGDLVPLPASRLHRRLSAQPQGRASATPRIRPSVESDAKRRDLRVLLVDGDEIDRMATRRDLERTGIVAAVREADGVSAAFLALREEPFDCALVDFSLPDGDAFDLLECLHETKDDGVALIILTDLDAEEMGVRLIRAGAQDFLSKHRTNADTLLRAVRHAIERHRTHRQLEAAQRRVEEARDSDPGTGLLSRQGLTRRIEAARAGAAQRHELIWVFVAVKVFDGKRAQRIAPGNQLARELADLLRDATPEPELVCRLDAAHFLCLAHGAFPIDAVTLARRIERALTGPEGPSHLGHPVAAQLVTGHTAEHVSADELCAIALEALDQHGDQEANCLLVQATSDALSMALFERSRALDGPNPIIHFVEQPIVSLQSSATWARELFLAPPEKSQNRFVSFAGAGALLDFDFQCFDAALHTLPHVDAGLVFVNLHPWAVRDPRFVESLQSLVDASLTERVVLEVSQLWIPEPEALAVALERARQRGFRVSIDNLRPGFDAAELLVRVRPDYVKTSVAALAEAARDRAALDRLRRLCQLAESLEIEAIALGVDSPAMRGIVDAAGFSHAQGFLFGRPAPVASVHVVG